jgi:hypothetical protein
MLSNFFYVNNVGSKQSTIFVFDKLFILVQYLRARLGERDTVRSSTYAGFRGQFVVQKLLVKL